MRPHTRKRKHFSRFSDHHIWITITHNKPRATSRDLRLVTDSSRNLQTLHSLLPRWARRKSSVLNAGKNAANTGPDLRYQALIECASTIFAINFPKKALLKSIVCTFFASFAAQNCHLIIDHETNFFWLEISLKAVFWWH